MYVDNGKEKEAGGIKARELGGCVLARANRVLCDWYIRRCTATFIFVESSVFCGVSFRSKQNDGSSNSLELFRRNCFLLSRRLNV